MCSRCSICFILYTETFRRGHIVEQENRRFNSATLQPRRLSFKSERTDGLISLHPGRGESELILSFAESARHEFRQCASNDGRNLGPIGHVIPQLGMTPLSANVNYIESRTSESVQREQQFPDVSVRTA